MPRASSRAAHIDEEEGAALGRGNAELRGDALADVAIGSPGALDPGRARLRARADAACWPAVGAA